LFGIGLYKITKIIWFCLSGREKSEPFSMKLRTRCGHGKRKIPSEFPLTGFFVPRTGITKCNFFQMGKNTNDL
jgi:hypothetical protein